jgi:IclR family KDG regulon transcriptional repressor
MQFMCAEKLRSGVRSVQVALDILEAVAFSDEEIGVSQIAAQIGLAKGAAFRHLHTLVDRGYVVQNSATARYQIGIKFQLLGRFRRKGSNLFTAAEGPMTDLRNAVGETVVLSSAEQSGPRILATTRGNSTVEIGVRPGSTLQFESSAQGKVMLAFGPPELFEQFQQSFPDKKRRKAIDRDVSRARRQGWLDAPGEVMRGINAIAAPIFDASALCVGAIAIVGLFDVTPRSRNEQFVSALLRSAERTSINLGRRNPAKSVNGQSTLRSDLIRRRRQHRVAP